MYEAFSQILKEAREARGLSQKELARLARVPLMVVRNLEEGEWSKLPEEVYLRWFVERLARILDIPPFQWHPVVEGLKPRVDLSSVAVRKVEDGEGWGWKRSLGLVLIILVVLGGLLWLGMEGREFGKWGRFFPHLSGKVAIEDAGSVKARVSSRVSVLSSVAKPEAKEAEAALVRVHLLVLRAKAPCWVRMKLEGGSIRDFILKPGERYTVPFTKALEMKLGNPGGVEILLDKKPLSLGNSLGTPKRLKVTPYGLEELTTGKRGS